MNEFFAQLQEQLSRVWENLNTQQKLLFVLAPSVLLIALIVGVYIASRPDYVQLVSTRDEARLQEIRTALEAQNIDYQLDANTIKVPRDVRYSVRLDLAGQGLLGPTTGPGFELFDVTRLGMTERIFDAQYVRALQNELARTIRIGTRYDDVQVHLSIPEPELFKEDQDLPKASVKISATGAISQDQAIGIQNLVAGAVPKLAPERVRILDRNNKPIAGVAEEAETGAELASKHDQVRRQKEAALYGKLSPVIEKLVGPDNYILTVELKMDWTEKTERERKLDMESQAPVSEKTYSESSQSLEIAGEPGVGGNVQDTGIGEAGGGTIGTEIEETITNYDYSTTETETVHELGVDKSTHISIALNYRENEETGELEPYDQTLQDELRQHIIAAAGITTEENNGLDTLSIKSFPFDRRELEQKRREFWLEQAQRLIRSVLPVIALAVIAVLAWLFFQRAFQPKPVEEEEVEEVPIEPVTETRELTLAQLGLAEFGDIASLPAEEQRRLKMQEHVISFAQEKPEEVAAIIKAWLSG